MRIGLFIPCYIDAFFPEVGIATLDLLELFGHEVVYPLDQTSVEYDGLFLYYPRHASLAPKLRVFIEAAKTVLRQ